MESSGQSNRLFILLAIGLLGLVCVGLLGLVATYYLIQANQAEQAALPTETPFIPEPTFTATLIPTSTSTPLPPPTPTPTLVVKLGAQEAAVPDSAQPADTATPAPPANTPETPPAAEEPAAKPTPTSMMPQATETRPAVMPTNTLVVQPPTPEVAATQAAATPTRAPAAELPQGGDTLPLNDHPALIWTGLALLVVLGLGLARYFKSPASS